MTFYRITDQDLSSGTIPYEILDNLIAERATWLDLKACKKVSQTLKKSSRFS